MGNTFWESSADISGLGPHDWAHGEIALSPDFDEDYYKFQPRHSMIAMSHWDEEISRDGAYPALGSPDWVIQIVPIKGKHIALVFEMFVDSASTGRIKVYLKDGASREQLDLRDSGGTFANEVTSTVVRSGVNPLGSQAVVTEDLTELGTLGNQEGEDVELEFYLENTGGTAVNVRNMRVHSGSTIYTSDYGI